MIAKSPPYRALLLRRRITYAVLALIPLGILVAILKLTGMLA